MPLLASSACHSSSNAPLYFFRPIEHPTFAVMGIETKLNFTASNGRNIRIAIDYLSLALLR